MNDVGSKITSFGPSEELPQDHVQARYIFLGVLLKLDKRQLPFYNQPKTST